jgi:bifunctional non-homologous end joining protein LigD
VIGGYNPNAGSFQSILAGYYEGDKLMFAGKVRQGLNPVSRAALFNKMKRLVIGRCPFCNLPPAKRVTLGKASPPMT